MSSSRCCGKGRYHRDLVRTVDQTRRTAPLNSSSFDLARIELLAMLLSIPGASSLVVSPGHAHVLRHPIRPNVRAASSELSGHIRTTWSPQDLTNDNPGFLPIPDDDYVKAYQRNPELWPVEFFLIAYRRASNEETGARETQVLVRRSANGTSKWGVGTCVSWI